MIDDAVNMSYPIIADFCPDLPMMVKSNVQVEENLQMGVNLSNQNFKFVRAADDRGSILRLKCSVNIQIASMMGQIR